MQQSPKLSPSYTYPPPSPKNFSPPFRYSSDFTELNVLGKGAYGEVFKVENKLDGCTYAVKKIKLEDDEEANRRILREVSALSRLTHKYIVRYYQSWIEAGWTYNNLATQISAEEASAPVAEGSSKELTDFDFQIPSISNINLDSLRPRNQGDESSMDVFLFDYSTDNGGVQKDLSLETPKKGRKSPKEGDGKKEDTVGTLVCFACEKKYLDWEVSFDEWKLIEARLQPLNLCEDCYLQYLRKTGAQVENIQIRRKTIGPFFLYIQIQYCDNTLRELMDDGSLWVIWKAEEIWTLFRQIVEALEFVHQQKYIHRDLKPSNIFLLNGTIKLGDFGLATCRAEREVPIESLLYDSHRVVDRSYNVGTYLYAPPEMTRKEVHTEKVDIYSLGIVLFEMWQHFHTTMERCLALEALRKEGKLPQTFVNTYPKQSEMILKLTNSEPSLRPSAGDILKEIPHKSSRGKPVRGLGAHLARVSMENSRLVEDNMKLQQRLLALEQKVTLLERENLMLKAK